DISQQQPPRRRHRITRADAGTAALRLARDQSVKDIVEAGAAIILRNGDAEHAERTHFAHDVGIELALAIGGEHARKQFLLRVVARGVAHHALFLAQLAFKVERIVPPERGVFDLRGFGAALLGFLRNLRHRGLLAFPVILRSPHAARASTDAIWTFWAVALRGSLRSHLRVTDIRSGSLGASRACGKAAGVAGRRRFLY